MHNLSISKTHTKPILSKGNSSFGYYAFGSSMKNRSIGGYRFGYQGSEKDGEIKGEDNHYTTEYRQHDPRLGRWFSRDLIVKHWESSYAVNHNNPIYFIDPLGLDPEER